MRTNNQPTGPRRERSAAPRGPSAAWRGAAPRGQKLALSADSNPTRRVRPRARAPRCGELANALLAPRLSALVPPGTGAKVKASSRRAAAGQPEHYSTYFLPTDDTTTPPSPTLHTTPDEECIFHHTEHEGRGTSPGRRRGVTTSKTTASPVASALRHSGFTFASRTDAAKAGGAS